MNTPTTELEHVGRTEEIAFWRDFVTSERFRANWLLATPNPELDLEVDLLVRGMIATSAETIRILDIGSGPVSHFSNGFPRDAVELHAADPLADDYDALWDDPLKAASKTTADS